MNACQFCQFEKDVVVFKLATGVDAYACSRCIGKGVDIAQLAHRQQIQLETTVRKLVREELAKIQQEDNARYRRGENIW